MDSSLTAYITLVATSGVLNLYLSAYVYLKRREFADTASYYVLYSASIAIYCFAYAVGLASDTVEQIMFWTIIQYIGMPFAPPLGLLFIMKYLGIKITRTRFVVLLIIPAISLVMIATNHLHHLHYKVFEIPEGMSAPYINIEVGPWYVIHGIYTFGSMFAALLLLLSRWRETARPYRFQVFTLILSQLVPIIAAFLYLIGAAPPGIDPVPMVIWVTSGLYLIAIVTTRMLKIIPIAKDTIFNSMNDGVFVLDASNRLIEYNQACRSMFPKLLPSMLGQHLDRVWEAMAGKRFPFDPQTAANVQEVQLMDRIYEVRTSTLKHRAGVVVIFIDNTKLKQLQRSLENLAYYDELTQIYNRRAFFERCEALYGTMKGRGPFAVILFDIDHFKRINDSYGHYVGDRLLVHVAKVCGELLEDEMLFARYGGEEFVLALSGQTADAGQALAERLRSQLASRPAQLDELNISVTSSFGVAEADWVKGETLQLLLQHADEALYQAKRDGRNRVCVYG